MKRLPYIYWGIPAAFVLTLLVGGVSGGLLHPAPALGLASVAALVLWGATWLRLYGTQKLRPEFSVLAVVPQMVYYAMHAAGPEVLEQLKGDAYQNFYALLWLAAGFTLMRALLPGPQDEVAGKRDGVFIFMSIILVLYVVYSWTAMASQLFLS
ncbi:MAG: hypothetical protein Q4F30_02635 [Akkermansia sp.]|nr:hypothetical protein [Akkermansia sp.]